MVHMQQPDDEGTAYLGLGTRLKAGPAEELVESAYRLEIADAPILYEGLSLADLAHSIMLIETGIVPREGGRELLALLLAMHTIPVDDFPLDPALGDVYNSREHYINQRAPAAGGWLHAGRPRREAATIAYRLAVRRRLLTIVQDLCHLARATVDQAEAHIATVMPDYTYLQHAQPTSLAHYLLSFVFPMTRDLDRLRTCFARTNVSPGGAGSINGSRLPLDRQRVAELLGFDGVIHNTRDAMWQADGPIEILATIVALLVNLDRLAEDLQIWVTREFNMVELADEHCRTSVIMPQKKNPYSLAFVRGVAGEMIGRLASMASVGKTPSAQVDNRIFAYGEVPRSLDLASQTVRLMAGVVSGLRANVELMARRAAEGYAQATDLADVIMLEAGLDYRAAHRVMGLVVRTAIEEGVPAQTITSDMLDQAAVELLGHPLGLPEATIAQALDPAAIVGTRTGLGGAAADPVRAMIAECRQRIAEAEGWRAETESRLAQAEETLVATAGAMAAVETPPEHLASF